ncbi:E3 ubiquitin-protein ligase TRIM45 [Ambystoma mexicanum]|uniref:E3 ubiquitin-protein ligase TRIM45 n=1 Tax=Ambystoma mexicanum TaxID=8296 RepID=UPI0037E8C7A7
MMSADMKRLNVGTVRALPRGTASKTRCPLCTEPFTDPRILPCLHTFCMACIRQLEPLSPIGFRGGVDQASSPREKTTLSVLCPVCDGEVELPPGGARALVVDHLVANEVLLESLQRNGVGLVCDLCNEGSAEKRCNICRTNLCEFCCQAHRRQKKTASHSVVGLKDLKPCSRMGKPIQCTSHPLEELRLFCETCDRPVCRDCVVGDHRDHAYDFTASIIHKHGDYMRELLKCTQPHVGALEGALRGIEGAGKAVADRLEAIKAEIDKFADGYVQAVEEHRGRLLTRLEELRMQREHALQLQRAQLGQLLSDMRTGVDFTERLLTAGSDIEILVTKGVVVHRLRKLNKADYSVHPSVDDCMRFSPSEKADQCCGYEMFGAIVTKAVDPSKCTLHGEDFHSGREEQTSVFTLICKDASAERMGRGGEQVRVGIVHKDRKDCVIKPTIQDNNDGTYSVSYTPHTPGMYTVGVCINGHHVQGSPFLLTVKSKFRKHQGVFHCCTFCSSRGQKDARCACGGSMPGGYQGCGHGHKGHPGRSHWSCCGRTQESSECTGPAGAAGHRSLLRTVAL